MSLEKILAENMVRFGTKNLTNLLKAKLIEQSQTDGSNNPTVQQDVNIDQSKVTDVNVNAYLPTDSIALAKLGTQKSRIAAVSKKNPKATEIETELAKNSAYTDFIQHLSTYANSTSAIIWYLKLNQANRIDFLNYFAAEKSKIDSKLSNDKQYEIILDKKGVKKISGTKIPSIPPLPLAVNTAGPDVFIDNKSDLTTKIKEQIDALINDADFLIKQFQKDYPDIAFKATNINIGSSSSRFRNTEEAANLTWAELSKNRSTTAYNYLIGELAKVGIEVDTNVVFKGGYNGDGTSGPNPGKDENGNQYTISKDGTFNNILASNEYTTEKINEHGKPLATKPEYDIYKWLVLTCDLEAIVKKIKPIEPKAIAEYQLDIKISTEPGRLKTPPKYVWPEMKFSNTTHKDKAKQVLDACPIWNEN